LLEWLQAHVRNFPQVPEEFQGILSLQVGQTARSFELAFRRAMVVLRNSAGPL
jgi:hypothetical protein